MRRAQLAAHHRCLSKLTVTTEPCQSHASGVLPEKPAHLEAQTLTAACLMKSDSH